VHLPCAWVCAHPWWAVEDSVGRRFGTRTGPNQGPKGRPLITSCRSSRNFVVATEPWMDSGIFGSIKIEVNGSPPCCAIHQRVSLRARSSGS
jgi:hypothetical protein